MRRRWKRVLVLGGVVLLVGGGIYLWQRTRPAPAIGPPEVPASVVDADVRAALNRSRAKVQAEPQSGQAWGELGLTYRAHNLNAESNACFATAAKLDPSNPRWPYLIGTIDLLIAPDEAVPHLRIARGLAVKSEHQSLTRLRLAEALLDRGDSDGAAELFAEEARVNPLGARAQFGLGAVAVGRGDHRAAIGPLLLAVDSPFARRKAGTLLAACHRRLGNAADAERCERDASGLPDDLPWPDPFLGEYARRESGRSARMKAIDELEASGRIAEAVAVRFFKAVEPYL